jgi:hypothetical protein
MAKKFLAPVVVADGHSYMVDDHVDSPIELYLLSSALISDPPACVTTMPRCPGNLPIPILFKFSRETIASSLHYMRAALFMATNALAD